MSEVLDRELLSMSIGTVSDRLLQYMCENGKSEAGLECDGTDETDVPYKLIICLKKMEE